MDKGKEFTGNISEDYFKSINVGHFVSHNQEIKANYVKSHNDFEVVNVKLHVCPQNIPFHRCFTRHSASYNCTQHCTISMSPSEVKPGDVERNLWWYLYKPKEVFYKWKACKVAKLKYKRGNKV